VTDWATVAAVASAFGVGGVLGALLTATHERTERFRDRMITVADEFLRHTGEARRHLTLAGERFRAGDTDAASGLLTTAGRHADDAYHLLPRLAVLFPSRGRHGDVVDSARTFVATITEKRNALLEALPPGNYTTAVAPRRDQLNDNVKAAAATVEGQLSARVRRIWI
jgi:hypothetical protein